VTDIRAEEVLAYLNGMGLAFEAHRHPRAGTSAESFAARQAAAGRAVTGAKALVLRVTHDGTDELVLAVLKGGDRLSSRLLKQALRQRVGGQLRTSFATEQELAARLRGLQPGRVPPLGAPLLPDVAHVIVDDALLREAEVGFNAADFERSVIMATRDLCRALPQDFTAVTLRKEDRTGT
jgi:prolyl-tRNA editing enzyme YbaK/EbsC (Cys-tRNA(Pro) deacylase)